MRFAVLLVVSLGSATALAEPRCPLPAATCLPAHGHPVLETRINQLRDETQRRADRTDAQVQKLQEDVATTGARVADISKRVDDLALALNGLKDKVSKQDDKWIDILASGLFGSLVTWLLTAWLASRHRQIDSSTAVLKRYEELADNRAAVAAILDENSNADLTKVGTRNVLIGLGNWYETVAEAYQSGSVERGQLWDLGLVKEAQHFIGEVGKLANKYESIDPQVAARLKGMVDEWTFLGQLKGLSRPPDRWLTWRRRFQ